MDKYFYHIITNLLLNFYKKIKTHFVLSFSLSFSLPFSLSPIAIFLLFFTSPDPLLRRPSPPAKVSQRSPQLVLSVLAQKRRGTPSTSLQPRANCAVCLARTPPFWPLLHSCVPPPAQLSLVTTSVGSICTCRGVGSFNQARSPA